MVNADEIMEAEKHEFRALHADKGRELLERPLQELFSIRKTRVPVPKKAVIEPSKPCACCQEPTMVSKLEKVNGELLCRDCAGL
ncbi:MAG: hypothetical protein ACLFUT_05210 [Desulfobacteraceae bacterium]